jgi:hypothetical protein
MVVAALLGNTCDSGSNRLHSEDDCDHDGRRCSGNCEVLEVSHLKSPIVAESGEIPYCGNMQLAPSLQMTVYGLQMPVYGLQMPVYILRQYPVYMNR